MKNMSDPAQINPVPAQPLPNQSVPGDPLLHSATTSLVNGNGPVSVAQTAPLNTPVPTAGRRKEVISTPLPAAESVTPTTELQPISETPVTPEQSGNQPAEYEAAQAELEPAIEKLQAEIEQNKMKAPDQIAVRQDTADQAVPKTVAQPVVILPLTEQKMKDGEKKSPTFSVRWLVAWAKRQMKKFKDILVVYRDSSYNQDK